MGKLRSLVHRLRRDRGASGVEYALVISTVLVGSLGSIEMMEPRIEDNYESTATDIGQVDLDYFRVTTTASPTTSGAPTTTTSPTTTAAPTTTTTAAPTTTTTASPTTTAAAAPTTTAPANLKVNATSATASGNFSSDGTGYGVPNSGNTNNWGGPDDTNDKITFTFTVTEAGTYNIKASVLAPSGSDNSFFVTVNGGPSDGFLWDTRESNSYRDDWVNDRNGGDPQGVYLEPGEHEVTLHKREDGTYVEWLELVLQN